MISLAVAFLAMLGSARGLAGGWTRAHATFYGGSDASGTMGELGDPQRGPNSL